MKSMVSLTSAAFLALGASATAVAFVGAPSKSATRPLLRIVDTDPLTVRGANFKVGEQVTVAAVVRQAEGRTPLRQRRLIRTGSAGGFTTALTLRIPGCAAIIVTATGTSGDTAAAKIIPECPAP